jgi:hypothetical protein
LGILLTSIHAKITLCKAGLAAIRPRWFVKAKRKSRGFWPPAFSLNGLWLVGLMVNQAREELGNIRNQPFAPGPHKDGGRGARFF